MHLLIELLQIVAHTRIIDHAIESVEFELASLLQENKPLGFLKFTCPLYFVVSLSFLCLLLDLLGFLTFDLHLLLPNLLHFNVMLNFLVFSHDSQAIFDVHILHLRIHLQIIQWQIARMKLLLDIFKLTPDRYLYVKLFVNPCEEILLFWFCSW